MSFCSEVKKEILDKKFKNTELKPFISALVKTIGELTINNNEISLMKNTFFADTKEKEMI